MPPKKCKTMAATEITKKCIQCNKPIKGRSDKKFCDDYCRAAHNNDLKSAANNYVRNVNNALSKNRRILESLLPDDEKMKKVNREKLLQQGFQFKYMTHTYSNQKGNIYYFCYEYGYLPLENDWFLVVKRDEG
jgi:predicted nucleic acid-binding Zn ribbon protein